MKFAKIYRTIHTDLLRCVGSDKIISFEIIAFCPGAWNDTASTSTSTQKQRTLPTIPQAAIPKPEATSPQALISNNLKPNTEFNGKKFFDLFLFLFFFPFFAFVRFVINNLRAEPKWNSSVFPSGNKTKKTTRKYNKIQTGRGGQHRGGHDTDSSTMLQISDSVNSFYAFRQNFCASSRLDCYENFRIFPESFLLRRKGWLRGEGMKLA